MSFETFNAEVDAQALNLRPHVFRNTRYQQDNNRRWYWAYACEFCGRKFEGFWQEEQICLGVLGEMMLAGVKVPRCWRGNFEERRRIARRAWKTKAKTKR